MISDKHKYYKVIKGLSLKVSCPSENCEAVDKLTYRFVYEDIKNEDNFLPQAIKAIKEGRPPMRRITEENTCEDYALSLFISEPTIREQWDGFSKRTKQLLGYSHIASGKIQKTDGVVTPEEEKGHFNLHEFIETNLQPKFKIVGKL